MKRKLLFLVSVLLIIGLSSVQIYSAGRQAETEDVVYPVLDGDASAEREDQENDEPWSLEIDDTVDLSKYNVVDLDIPLRSGTLPSSVDLRYSVSDPYFPQTIADQGSIQSDVAFASVYYQYTYEANKYNQIATTAANTYCPQYAYATLHEGMGGKTSFDHCYDSLSKLGSLKYSDYDSNFDFSDGTAFRLYCLDNTQARIDALALRAEATANVFVQYYNNNTISVVQLENIKSLLADGKVATILCNTGWNFETYTDNLNNQYHVVTHATNDTTTHALTIVGYDDSIWIDLNEDGIADSCELGAFLVADSQGIDVTNEKYGFFWILYDAINEVSESDATPIPNRVPLAHNMSSANATPQYVVFTIDIVEKDCSVIGMISYDNSIPYHGEIYYCAIENGTGTGALFESFPQLSCEAPFFFTANNGEFLFTGDVVFDLTDFVDTTSLSTKSYIALFRLRTLYPNPINYTGFSVIDSNNTEIASLSSYTHTNGFVNVGFGFDY